MKKYQIKKGICTLLTVAMSLSGAVGSMSVMAAQQEEGCVISDYAPEHADVDETDFIPLDQDVLSEAAQPEAVYDEEEIPSLSGEEETGIGDAADNASVVFEEEAPVEEEPLGDYTSAYLMKGNLNAQNYVRWASTIKSYVYATDDGYMTARADDSQIVFKYYDKEFKPIEGDDTVINNPLSVFGGLYRDSEGDFYAFFGQDISNDDPNAEVIRIVRYDSSLAPKGDPIILKNINTRQPFKSGSLRVAESGDYLYVRTAHKMFLNGGQYSHQANLTIEIKKSTMSVVDMQYAVSNISTGYASHSFDQYILVDDSSNLVAVDHQDSDPRAIIMGKYGTMAGLANFSQGSEYDYVEAFKIAGPNNNNASGVALGGFEYSSTNYLIAGSSVPQDKTWKEDNENVGRNIFICTVPRNDFGSVKYTFLTDYPAGSETFASAPQMVKYDNNRFLLIWNELKNGKANGKICYVWIDGDGKKVGDIHTRAGYVTDCHPIVVNGSVVWFSDDETSIEFVSVTPEDSEIDKKDDGPGNGGEADPGSSGEDPVPAGSVSADLIDGCYYMVKGSKAFIPGTKKLKGDKTHKVEYSVSKPTYVKLNSKGIISAKRPYDKPIMVNVTRKGKKTTFKVFVVEPEVVKKLYVNKGESGQIPVRNARKLTAKEFESYDDAAVSVSANGTVKAKEVKKVKVSYCIGTRYYKTLVVVCDQEIRGKDTIEVGKSMKLKLKNGAPGKTEWKSSSASVATVDESGKVTAVKAGKVVIAATNNGKTVTKTITVGAGK